MSRGILWNPELRPKLVQWAGENKSKGKPVVDPAYLSALVSRMRVIASDCFDLTAAERLRLMADEVVKTIAATPDILPQPKAAGDRREAK